MYHNLLKQETTFFGVAKLFLWKDLHKFTHKVTSLNYLSVASKLGALCLLENKIRSFKGYFLSNYDLKYPKLEQSIFENSKI